MCSLTTQNRKYLDDPSEALLGTAEDVIPIEMDKPPLVAKKGSLHMLAGPAYLTYKTRNLFIRCPPLKTMIKDASLAELRQALAESSELPGSVKSPAEWPDRLRSLFHQELRHRLFAAAVTITVVYYPEEKLLDGNAQIGFDPPFYLLNTILEPLFQEDGPYSFYTAFPSDFGEQAEGDLWKILLSEEPMGLVTLVNEGPHIHRIYQRGDLLHGVINLRDPPPQGEEFYYVPISIIYDDNIREIIGLLRLLNPGEELLSDPEDFDRIVHEEEIIPETPEVE
jgi:hypothetical protein